MFACILLYSVCTPFVLRLYPICTARDFSSFGFLYSVCIPLYSCVLRLYWFVPLGTSFPKVVVFHLYPFVLSPRLANIILLGDGRSTKVQKMRKCDPSIVLGARWLNGITTARAVAAAPVRPTGKGWWARLRACVRICVCVFTKAFGFLSSRTTRGEVQTLELI